MLRYAVILTLGAVVAMAGSAQAAWVGTNLSFETGTVGIVPPTDWVATYSGPVENDEFRLATGGGNWYPDTTAGNNVLLMDLDDASESGMLTQLLTGSAELGTYQWSVVDVGVTTFSQGSSASLTYGFSLDGTSFVASQTLTEGVELTKPGTSPWSGSVSYTAPGTETSLYLMIDRQGQAVRTVTSMGSSTLGFTPIPEPSTFLILTLGLLGLALSAWRRRHRGQ